jgi:hypothetical protein
VFSCRRTRSLLPCRRSNYCCLRFSRCSGHATMAEAPAARNARGVAAAHLCRARRTRRLSCRNARLASAVRTRIARAPRLLWDQNLHPIAPADTERILAIGRATTGRCGNRRRHTEIRGFRLAGAIPSDGIHDVHRSRYEVDSSRSAEIHGTSVNRSPVAIGLKSSWRPNRVRHASICPDVFGIPSCLRHCEPIGPSSTTANFHYIILS